MSTQATVKSAASESRKLATGSETQSETHSSGKPAAKASKGTDVTAKSTNGRRAQSKSSNTSTSRRSKEGAALAAKKQCCWPNLSILQEREKIEQQRLKLEQRSKGVEIKAHIAKLEAKQGVLEDVEETDEEVLA